MNGDVSFEMGRLVETAAANQKFSFDVKFGCLGRHLAGDWGDCSAEDKKLNDSAVVDGTRILSSYNTAEGKLWIITESDRSATTILLPEDY